MPKPGTPERDLRIDFFRGLALYMIIFDHIPGDPLGRLTYVHVGFSDAAEIFVFLSGLSCGIVYSRVLLRQSVGGLLRAVSKRALQIYLYYLIACVTTILLITLSRDAIAIPANHQAFISLQEDAFTVIRSAVFLVSPPELPGILVLYLELTFVVIPIFLLVAAYNGVVALALSGAIWLLSQIYPDLLPRLANHSYSNPAAWQFLFCIGMFIGKSYNDDSNLLDRFRTQGWMLLAWSIVAIGLAYKLAIVFGHVFGIDPAVPVVSDTALVHMKENLSPIRLVHFMSVALLVATYVKPSSSILRWPGANAVIDSGKCSLQVFCLGAVLSLILNLFVAVEGPFGLERIVLDCLTILLIASMASVLVRSRLERRSVTVRSPPVVALLDERRPLLTASRAVVTSRTLADR